MKAPQKKVPGPQQPKKTARAAIQLTRTKTGDQEFFGSTVKALREEAGMSQSEIAPLVGMAQARIPEIEQGRRDVRISTIRRFARALGVSPRDLLPPE